MKYVAIFLIFMTSCIYAQYGFNDFGKGIDYSYCDRGSLSSDLNKQIKEITFNHFDKIERVIFNNGNSISYIYDSRGNLLTTTSFGSSNETTDFSNRIQYSLSQANKSIKHINFTNGRSIASNATKSYQNHYFIKDNLNSIRLQYADINQDGVISQNYSSQEIISENDFYPFGLQLTNSNKNMLSPNESDLKFNGKRLNQTYELNSYNFGARIYSPEIGKFLSVDRFNEKYKAYNGYQYTANNPINLVDINGDSIDVNHLITHAPKRLNSLIVDLNAITGLRLVVSNKNKLIVDPNTKQASKYSKTGKDLLLKIISSEESIHIHHIEGTESAAEAGLNDKNESIIHLDFENISDLVEGTSKDMNPLTMSFGMILLHELLHTPAGGDLVDANKFIDYFIYPGRTVDQVNKVRKELGPKFGERTMYFYTKIGEFYYLPLSSASERALKLGIIPTKEFVRTE